MSTILIIDDEPGIRTVLRDILEDESYTVLDAEDGIQGLADLAASQVDVVFLDVWLPNMGGMDVLKKIREQYPDVEVIMISGHANISLAVQATKMGAFDFLEKPLSLDRTMTVVRNALAMEDLRKENRSLKKSIFIDDRMIGSGPGMTAVRGLIEQAAGSDSRILILGENGTGKELVAREVHVRSATQLGSVRGAQLRRHPRELDRERAVRPRKGGIHQRADAPQGKARGGQPRDTLP